MYLAGGIRAWCRARHRTPDPGERLDNDCVIDGCVQQSWLALISAKGSALIADYPNAAFAGPTRRQIGCNSILSSGRVYDICITAPFETVKNVCIRSATIVYHIEMPVCPLPFEFILGRCDSFNSFLSIK